MPPGTARLMLFALCVAFAAVRFPVAWRQLPAQDEDYFAVPGLTILEDGVPRIPFLPSRNPDGGFYRADEMLFALPPLLFYLEAAAYTLLGPSTGAARIVSLTCGVVAIAAVYAVGSRVLRSRSGGLWSAALYAASRVLYFPGITARPDMLCGLLGLGVLLAMWQWSLTRRRRWLVIAGCGVGLGLLSHPFAAVYAIQAGAWTLLSAGRVPVRLGRAALLTGVALVVFSAWGMLIVQHPEAFRGQFFNNVMGRSGPGLAARLIWTWPSFAAQIPLFIEHAGALQAALMLLGTAAFAVIAIRGRDPGRRALLGLAVSGVYLHVASVGLHPTKGYWCYTGALLLICTAAVIDHCLRHIGAQAASADSRVKARALFAVILAVAVMAPGSGLRTVAAHLRHWNDINYSAPRFTQKLIAETPSDARVIVDTGFVFAFYCAGREPVLAREHPFYFSVADAEFDLLVAGPAALQEDLPSVLDARFLRAYGDRDNPFACYAELYAAPPVESRRFPDAPR